MRVALPLIVYIISFIGILFNRTNIIIILICIEIMLISLAINFSIHSLLLQSVLGQVYAIMVVTIAASESAIGLSILVSFYKMRGSISIKVVNLLRG